MKIRIKAGDVEIGYEEASPESSYYFMLGKSKGGDYKFTEKHMECLQKLIDGVEQLLEATR